MCIYVSMCQVSDCVLGVFRLARATDWHLASAWRGERVYVFGSGKVASLSAASTQAFLFFHEAPNSRVPTL